MHICKSTHTNTQPSLVACEDGEINSRSVLGDRWSTKMEIVQCVLLGVLESNVGGSVPWYTKTHTQKPCLLTVEPNIMVGQDSWLVALGSPADHHVQHPIRGFNVMFLQQQQKKKQQFQQTVSEGLSRSCPNNQWPEMDLLRGLVYSIYIYIEQYWHLFILFLSITSKLGHVLTDLAQFTRIRPVSKHKLHLLTLQLNQNLGD